MIPEQFHGIWQKGIDTNDYYLKLCGSGGGGYILRFYPRFGKSKRIFKRLQIRSGLPILKMLSRKTQNLRD